MNSNYNDIIDVILTLIKDEDIAKSIAVSGSVVPYLVLNKESEEYHSDFYILVKQKQVKEVRDKLKSLSKEYQFDIVSDSKSYSNDNYGFKIKYENTTIGFFPYSLIDNNFTIRTFSINTEKKQILLKNKVIPEITKNNVIRLVRFGTDNQLRIISPEFVLADKEAREKQPGNPTKETMALLNKISDESVLNVIRKCISETKVKITSKPLKENNIILTIVLAVLFIILLVMAYICFKK